MDVSVSSASSPMQYRSVLTCFVSASSARPDGTAQIVSSISAMSRDSSNRTRSGAADER